MKILLTGANGFTGRVFKTQAEAAGHEVFVITSDLTDKLGMEAEVASMMPADAVVHLAAISFVGHADDSAFYGVNVIGTMNLLHALASCSETPRAVLLASSANVYGNCEASPIVENQAPAPVNHYATSKLAMEHMARTYRDRLPIIISRPFNYTGPGQAPQFLIPKLVNHFACRANSVELGNLNVEREFNDVRMVCDAYIDLLVKGVPGEVYNVCSGQPYTLNYVIDLLKQITSHQIEVKVNPSFVRANEVDRLYGSPDKLISCVEKLTHYSLRETLIWMLDNAQ